MYLFIWKFKRKYSVYIQLIKYRKSKQDGHTSFLYKFICGYKYKSNKPTKGTEDLFKYR